MPSLVISAEFYLHSYFYQACGMGKNLRIFSHAGIIRTKEHGGLLHWVFGSVFSWMVYKLCVKAGQTCFYSIHSIFPFENWHLHRPDNQMK